MCTLPRRPRKNAGRPGTSHYCNLLHSPAPERILKRTAPQNTREAHHHAQRPFPPGLAADRFRRPRRRHRASPPGSRTRGRAQVHRQGFLSLLLNTSTIRGQKLPLPAVIDIAAKAGYQAIEPWIRELDAVRQGRRQPQGPRQAHPRPRPDRRERHRLRRVDRGRRRRSARRAWRRPARDMDLVRQIGGKRAGRPPVGATDQADLDLLQGRRALPGPAGARRQDRRDAAGRGLGLLASR